MQSHGQPGARNVSTTGLKASKRVRIKTHFFEVAFLVRINLVADIAGGKEAEGV